MGCGAHRALGGAGSLVRGRKVSYGEGDTAKRKGTCPPALRVRGCKETAEAMNNERD